MSILRLEMLPAAEGDALLIEWGAAAKPYRMLVDAGPLTTYRAIHDRITALGSTQTFEALVVTHIDGDHIEGAVRLLQDRRAMHLAVGDIWFNGWPQLPTSDLQGAKYGEMVGALLTRDKLPWNHAFLGQAIEIPDEGTLPTRELDGGARLTVLTPGRPQLRKLKANWINTLDDEEGIRPGNTERALKALAANKRLRGVEARDAQGGGFKPDSSVANGSSISLLFEYDQRALLLTGDSHSAPLVTGLNKLLKERGGERLRVDAFKLPHHCSAANVSEDLLALVDTPRYLVSTSGARHEHPDEDAMVRVLETPHRGRGTQIFFNYLSKTTAPWTQPASAEKYGYTPKFPAADAPGIVVEV
jgi:beta-lactamase superfamily II metal-dependent hydrolase